MTSVTDSGKRSVLKFGLADEDARWFASAHTAAPTPDDAHEVDVGGYERAASNWRVPNGGTAALSGHLRLGTGVAEAVTVTHVGFYDSRLGGNLLAYAPVMDNSVDPPVERPAQINAGDVIVADDLEIAL